MSSDFEGYISQLTQIDIERRLLEASRLYPGLNPQPAGVIAMFHRLSDLLLHLENAIYDRTRRDSPRWNEVLESPGDRPKRRLSRTRPGSLHRDIATTCVYLRSRS